MRDLVPAADCPLIMVLRTLLIDDEPASRLRLRRLLAGRSELEIVGEAGDGLEAIARIEALRPDLIFLDVQMPGLDGFEVLRSIPVPAPLPLVIFVTAFDEHALRAFQAQALAYLLKPIETDLLDAALQRAYSIHGFQEQRALEESRLRGALEDTPPSMLERVVARRGSRILLLAPEEICFFRMDSGVVRAHTAAENYLVNYPLGVLESGLSARKFFRAHRSVLANLDQIAEIRPDVRSTYQLVMKDRERTVIDVSERQGRVLRTLIPGL
jgi:two-component system, LytTR family, response regulator